MFDTSRRKDDVATCIVNTLMKEVILPTLNSSKNCNLRTIKQINRIITPDFWLTHRLSLLANRFVYNTLTK